MQHGADVSITDSRGSTALHLAAHFGKVNIVRLLLEKDSKLALRGDNNGDTPLHCAAAKGVADVIEALLEVFVGISLQ